MKKPNRHQKPLQQTEDEAKERHHTFRRKINTGFLFWTVCSDGPCKRAKRCVGDGEACFQRWWPHVPEECKLEMRAFIDGLRRGLSLQEAGDQIDSKLAEWKALEELSASEQERPAALVEPEPVNKAAHALASGPRVRSL